MSNVLKQILGEAIPGLGDQHVNSDEFTEKPPHKGETIDHGNGIVQKFLDGDEAWYKDGKFHRDNDLPALIWNDGSQFWYQNGKLHRDGDKPAIIRSDGSLEWWRHGKLHRDGGKPAVIYSDGSREWWINNRPSSIRE